MRNILLVLIFSLGSAPQSFGATAGDTAPVLNQKMSAIGTVLADLFPLIVVQRELNGAEQTQLKIGIARLIALFREAGPHIRKRSEAYNVSYQLVLDHLDETKRALDGNFIERTRMDLYALGPICTSCHTQDTQLRSAFAGAQRARFPTDLAYAEFNYLTRNYAQAEQYYDAYLKSAQDKTEFDIVQPLQRLITIYTQVLNQPGAGAEKLKRYIAIKGHSATTKKHLDGWIAGLRSLDASGAAKVSDPDIKTVEGYVRQYLGPLETPLTAVHVAPEQEIARVWLRGRLYQTLNRTSDPTQIPKLLYWLAVTDRAIGYEYSFSLADLYLKDCVLTYSSDPYAQRCFDEYNEYITYAYSGSGGNFTPPEMKTSLEKLRSVLNAAQGTKH
jgi:hypothetical protein